MKGVTIPEAVHEGDSTFQVVVGVDTHQDKHVAVSIDRRGVRLGEFHTPTTTRGYRALERWSLVWCIRSSSVNKVAIDVATLLWFE